MQLIAQTSHNKYVEINTKTKWLGWLCVALLIAAPCSAKMTDVERLVGLQEKIRRTYSDYSDCMYKIQRIIEQEIDPELLSDNKIKMKHCYQKFETQMLQVKKAIIRTHKKVDNFVKTSTDTQMGKKLEKGLQIVLSDYRSAIRNVARYGERFSQMIDERYAELKENKPVEVEKESNPLDLDLMQLKEEKS